MFYQALIKQEDQQEYLFRIAADKELTLEESMARFLLDFIKSCEDSAKDNDLMTIAEIKTDDETN